MTLLEKILLPFVFAGFIAYNFKVYYHFLYLKIFNNYPKDVSFLGFKGFSFKYYSDRFETILPILFKGNKNGFSTDVKRKLELLEKRIQICLIIFVFGFIVIPMVVLLLKWI